MSERVRVQSKTHDTKKDNSISQTQMRHSTQYQQEPIDQVFLLQQALGNLAVQRLFNTGMFQAKLAVCQPNDKYENEAGRIADLVMRMEEPGCPECEEEERPIQSAPIPDQGTWCEQRRFKQEDDERSQVKGNMSDMMSAIPIVESSINSFKGGGNPLPMSAMSYFEPRFSYDFSKVRVHTDAKASETAKILNAKAFTVGENIFFSAGQYSPETFSGNHLLAHELTHVIQQESGLHNNSPSVLQRNVYDLLNTTITPQYARSLSDHELEENIYFLRDEIGRTPDPSLSSNLEVLEAEAFRRIPSVEILHADVSADSISIRLAPSEATYDLTLELLGTGGSHLIRREPRSGGTINESFNIPGLRQGEYNGIKATWGGTVYSHTYPYHIHVLGVYRHSQYNIPHENTCAAPTVNVYITDGACHFVPSTLRQQFVNQVNLNGSGVSIAHGNLRRESFCIGRPTAPADARNRSFRQVAALYGSCNGDTGALNNSTVARRPGHPHLDCDDRVFIDTVGVKTVTDLCPGCAQAHLDNFTTAPACSGIRDLGNFMTIKLF